MMHKERFHLTVSGNILTKKSLRNWEVLVTHYIVQKINLQVQEENVTTSLQG